MNQWPNVRLRVIEGWDEDNRHSLNSLHYEGRAVDITTSDRDKSKYGMLARLAVEAGFDWVHYESRSHVHCSVKSEKSDTIKNNGCFDAKSLVETPWGRMEMSQLQTSDLVLTMNPLTGQLQFSPVILWLDRDEQGEELFVELTTKGGRQIRLTSSHLIYVADEVPAWKQEAYNSLVDLKHITTTTLLPSTSKASNASRTNHTSQESVDNIPGSSDNNRNNYFYFYETAANESKEVAQLAGATAQKQMGRRIVSTNTNSIKSRPTVNEYTFTTYSRNAIVGQYLLIHSPIEQVDLKVNQDGSTSHLNKEQTINRSRRQSYLAHINSRQSVVESDKFPTQPPNIARVEFDQITNVNFVSSKGIYAPLTREGNLVVNSIVASCYAVINDHDMAHMSFAPIRWFSYLSEWLFGLRPEVPTEERTLDYIETGRNRVGKQVRDGFMSDEPRRKDFQYVQARSRLNFRYQADVPSINGLDRTTLEQQQQQHRRHIHWYPILLYNIARYILPLGYLY